MIMKATFKCRDDVPSSAAVLVDPPKTSSSKQQNRAASSRSSSSFENLITKRQVGKIGEILSKNSDDEDEVREFLSGSKYPLHQICAVQPPLNVVGLLIKKLYQVHKNKLIPEDSINGLGETPLHVAVANGCPSNVVSILINGFMPGACVSAARTQDSWKRYPLHWACCTNYYSPPRGTARRYLQPPKILKFFSNNRRKKKAAMDNHMETVTMLAKAFPLAVRGRDRNGHTPKELAEKYQNDPRVEKLMEKVEKDLREVDGSTMTSGTAAEDISSSNPSPRILGFPCEISVISGTDAFTDVEFFKKKKKKKKKKRGTSSVCGTTGRTPSRFDRLIYEI